MCKMFSTGHKICNSYITIKATYLSDWVFAEDTSLTILTPADIGTDEQGAPNTLYMHKMSDN